MAGTQDTDRDGTGLAGAGVIVTPVEVNDWFVREVLPLEAELTRFLQQNWRNRSDIEDLCQDIYVRAYENARQGLPKSARAYVFTIARNLLIDRIRNAQIVPIETIADLESLTVASDQPSADQRVMARQELRRLQTALEELPPRCREAVILKKIEGLSIREIAQRMGISVKTVDRHLSEGACYLADFLYGESARLGGKA
jgi:RNA polymerase sigma factor (sigma-70 family)